MTCQLHALGFEFFFGVDAAGDLAPDLKTGLGLADHFVHPIFGHMTIRANGAHTGAVAVVDGLFVLLVHRVTHFVTGGAKLQGVGHLHGGVEPTPKNNARHKRCAGDPDQRIFGTWFLQEAPHAFEKPGLFVVHEVVLRSVQLKKRGVQSTPQSSSHPKG